MLRVTIATILLVLISQAQTCPAFTNSLALNFHVTLVLKVLQPNKRFHINPYPNPNHNPKPDFNPSPKLLNNRIRI